MALGPQTHAGIDALLRPQSIVVLGASAKRSTSGNAVISNLLRHGYAGEIHVVHPTATEVENIAARPTVADLPHSLDAAVVSLPAAALMDALRQLDAQGCRAALVPTAGLTASQSDELAAFTHESPMVVHGNNCMGIVNVSDDIPLWTYDAILSEQRRGGISLVSQSGSATFVSRAIERAGFSKIISTGNEVSLTSSDYLAWLATDPETTVVGLVLESLSNVDDFVDAVRLLRAAGKPVVALKVGGTALGAKATAAHTGAIVGDHAAYQALFRQLDIPLVADYDELAESLKLLGTPGVPQVRGRRVAVITDSGGEAGLAADLSSRYDIELPTFSEPTLARAGELMPGASINNPFDAGASPAASEEAYDEAHALVAADSEIDAVMIIAEAHHTLGKAEIGYLEDMRSAVVAAASSGKPVLIAASSSTATSAELDRFLPADIPVVRGIGNAFAAIAAAAGNTGAVPPRIGRPAHLPSPTAVRALRATIGDHAGSLPPELCRELLTAYRIPVVESALVRTAEDALTWARDRFPVVVKVASADVLHRSDVGGVVTSVQTEAELTDAIARIRESVLRAHPAAIIDGYEIQHQVNGAHEALLGFTTDPVFGAVATVGAGGVLVELERDAVSSPAPVDTTEALHCIAGTRMSRVLDGYRNLHPTTDLSSLAAAMTNLSWLAADFAGLLEAADLNPVFVEYGSGAITIVDMLMIASDAETRECPTATTKSTLPQEVTI
ncbi:acetate--CoA ligase family protein [Rhodococcus sp. NPDC056960]|uniref:acetate--CoA ligase family protein n=1 Tax=Rhodococcus sp. NPDC056960 TaxID=3345982 RepID=UPI00362F7183